MESHKTPIYTLAFIITLCALLIFAACMLQAQGQIAQAITGPSEWAIQLTAMAAKGDCIPAPCLTPMPGTSQ